jgi:IS4 transposase
MNLQSQNNTTNSKKQPILKITKGKLGNKMKKRDDDDDDGDKNKNKMQIREIKGMEEMYWRVEHQQKQADQIKAKIDNPNIFDLIYEPYELYSDYRKRNQIEILQGAVFELK